MADPATGAGDSPRADWISRWWAGEAGLPGRGLDLLLWPAERLYSTAIQLRNSAYDAGVFSTAAPPIPVISVGNLTVGGTGKTPVTAWIAGQLHGRDRAPAIVTRGYGGDEILVHRELNPDVPVHVFADRVRGVQDAARSGARVAVLDDAFQHRRLGRTLDIVLISAETWRGPRRLLPRGGWREPPSSLARADLLVVTRKTATEAEAAAAARELESGFGSNAITCHLAPAGLVPLHPGGAAQSLGLGDLAGRQVLAIASLAQPGAFFAQLRSAGAQVATAEFPDHHAFTAAEAAELVSTAGGKTLVMTRKDAVKLRPLIPEAAGALVLDQRVELGSDESVLVARLEEVFR